MDSSITSEKKSPKSFPDEGPSHPTFFETTKSFGGSLDMATNTVDPQPSAPQQILDCHSGNVLEPTTDHVTLKETPVSAPKCYTCPITGELMRAPVTLVESAQTYEQKAIVDWLEQGNRHCPVTGIPLLHCSLIQNLALKNAISYWMREHGLRAPMGVQQDPEFDHVVALLEDQLKGMYKGWDSQEELKNHNEANAIVDDESGMLEELSRLICSNDRATNQAAALSLARACWGCHRSQTIVGNCKASMDGILARLVYLLRGEIESGRPGHMAWALAEVIRYHHKNQMRLFRVRDLDTLGMLVCMLKSNDDQWVARGARVVGAWCSSNHSIQNVILESGIIALLVECLRGPSSIQKLHAGMALMHIAYQNRVTSMQILKDGALLYVPMLLNSRALVVRAVGGGMITHLLGLFDYSWGENTNIFKALVALLNQCEDYTGIIASSAIFELVHRDKVDLKRLTDVCVLPRVLDLIVTCHYPAYRRAAKRFLLKWAKYVTTSSSGRRNTTKAIKETIKTLAHSMTMNITSISEIAINVIWILLPLNQNYKIIQDSLDRFEKMSMDATISENGRSMCKEIVSYVRKVDMEHRTRVQVFFTTLGVCVVLKFIKFIK